RRVLCLVALNRDADAVRATEQLAGIRWNVGTVHGDLPMRTALGLTRLRAGDRAGAAAAALEAAGLLEHLMPSYHGYVFDPAGTADVLLQLLERPAGAADARWSRALQVTLKSLRRMARVFPIARPWLALLTGRAHRVAGKSAAARAQWQVAVRLGEEFA